MNDSKRYSVTAVLCGLLLFSTTATAQQTFGTPSNLAGVWTMTVSEGTHLVSFPLLPEDPTLENVLGDQLPGGEQWDEASRLVTVVGGVVDGAFYHSTDEEWQGTLDMLDTRRGYWLVIPEGAGEIDLEMVGAAMDADTIDMGIIQPGMTLVSAGAPYPGSMSSSGMVQSGFSSSSYEETSDRVYKWEAGSLQPGWHAGQQQGWQGSVGGFSPEAGYVVVVINPDGGFHWRRPRDLQTPPPLLPGGTLQVTAPTPYSLPIPSLDVAPWEQQDGSDNGKKKREKR
ncbi:hypothetical protein GF324_02275 [bacterium]|nr:hypothetical protein [bacterium]